MTFKIKVKLDKWQDAIKAAPEAAGRAVAAVAYEGERYVKQSMSDSPATGRAYVHGGATHIASSPGNPPRPDVGNLLNSINVKRMNEKLYAIRVGSEQGVLLEFGTTYMEARPFMGPAAAWLKKNATRIAKEAFGDLI